MTADSRVKQAVGTPQGGLRTVLTLLLIFHIFLVGASISSNYAPSDLQFQIVSRFKPYTRLFNFDLNFTPYHLTHATEADVDHRMEILPEGKDERMASDWLALPDRGFRGGDAYKRYQRLGATWAFQAQNNGEPATFAQAIGTHFARQWNIKPKQIRCRRHFLQSREDIAEGTPARRDPNDPSYFVVVYAANAIVSESGYVEVVRVDDASQVAQPTRPEAGTRGPSKNESSR